MTIVVGVASPDGLVLAGDRRTTYSRGDAHRIASDNAQKVFAVGNMGVATYGDAFIGRDTIAGLMDQFIAQLGADEAEQVDSFIDAIARFFDARFREAVAEAGVDWDYDNWTVAIGFLVAGYDDHGIGHIKEVVIPGPPTTGELDATTTEGGAAWRGQTGVILRLLKGVDWLELGLAGVGSDDIPDELLETLRQLEYVPLAPITVQDAVDYASFLVRTTIDMQRFSDGTRGNPEDVPGCGGSTLILAVERGRLKWVNGPALKRPSRAGWAEGAPPDAAV